MGVDDTEPMSPLTNLLCKSLSLIALLALPVAAIAFASCGRGEPKAAAPDLERGRYLVERVARCADCHSPRDAQGGFVAERWLQGAMLPFSPTVPMPWANAAPTISGLPSLPDDELAVHYLTTGELPGGRVSRPPMPPFRFTPDDARAVVAWLRTRPAMPAPGEPAVARASAAR